MPRRSSVPSVKPMTTASMEWRGLILNMPAVSLRTTAPSPP
jgi:hypothetical protein